MAILKGMTERSKNGGVGVCDVCTSAGLMVLRFYGGLEMTTKTKHALLRRNLHHKFWTKDFLVAWRCVYYSCAINQCAAALADASHTQ